MAIIDVDITLDIVTKQKELAKALMDEDSQSRMSRAINGLQENGTIEWKAKDNSKQILSILDLKEILYLAGQEQTRIWFNE